MYDQHVSEVKMTHSNPTRKHSAHSSSSELAMRKRVSFDFILKVVVLRNFNDSRYKLDLESTSTYCYECIHKQ
jgi:hypothetical protein